MDAIWDGFAELERNLKASDGEHFVHRLERGKGYKYGPVPYYPNIMREPFTVQDFVGSWGNGG